MPNSSLPFDPHSGPPTVNLAKTNSPYWVLDTKYNTIKQVHLLDEEEVANLVESFYGYFPDRFIYFWSPQLTKQQKMPKTFKNTKKDNYSVLHKRAIFFYDEDSRKIRQYGYLDEGILSDEEQDAEDYLNRLIERYGFENLPNYFFIDITLTTVEV